MRASCGEPLTEPSSPSGLRRWTRFWVLSRQVLSDFKLTPLFQSVSGL